MRVVWLLVVTLLAGCATARPGQVSPRDDAALRAALTRHIEILAGDDFAGRRPGTEGEAKTLRYLAREWQSAGLVSGTNDPANPWFAPVELASITPERSWIRFFRAGRQLPLPDDSATVFAASTRGLVERAPVVFVGDAGAELDNAELAGRVVLMSWDRPKPTERREALLSGGAAAVLAMVEDPGELADLVAARRGGTHRLASTDGAATIDGFILASAVERLVGADMYDRIRARSGESAAVPIALDLAATLEAVSATGSVKTFNLIAKLPGRRPDAGAVLLLAHWDHFGTCGEEGEADRLCNGAVDNASGLAVLTELARRLSAGPKLDRDVYFVATTAEEWGLLGALALAENPPVPLDTIVAAFNLDTVAVAPAGGPVAIVGRGLTGLDPGILAVLAENGRSESDAELAASYLRRQDGWALLQRDVPAVSVTTALGSPEALTRFTAERYHRPSDEAPGIELGGAIDDLFLTQALVRYFADPVRWPATAGKSVDPL